MQVFFFFFNQAETTPDSTFNQLSFAFSRLSLTWSDSDTTGHLCLKACYLVSYLGVLVKLIEKVCDFESARVDLLEIFKELSNLY